MGVWEEDIIKTKDDWNNVDLPNKYKNILLLDNEENFMYEVETESLYFKVIRGGNHWCVVWKILE